MSKVWNVGRTENPKIKQLSTSGSGKQSSQDHIRAFTLINKLRFLELPSKTQAYYSIQLSSQFEYEGAECTDFNFTRTHGLAHAR
jgi:hypothetical protein